MTSVVPESAASFNTGDALTKDDFHFFTSAPTVGDLHAQVAAGNMATADVVFAENGARRRIVALLPDTFYDAPQKIFTGYMLNGTNRRVEVRCTFVESGNGGSARIVS